MNPLAVLLPAIHLALTAPPLTWQGVTVPAGQFVRGNSAGYYVLISQPTDADAPGAAGCRHYSCAVLLDVVTQFGKDLLTAAPAEAIVGQLHQRLRGVRLPLPVGWDCMPGVLELVSQVEELDGELAAVRRLVRYRWELYYTI